MPKNLPVLYGYWRSSCSWRVRMALNWKGIEYESISVNLLSAEDKKAKLGDISPVQYVPVFVRDGTAISESLAIIEYLEEVYPEKRKLLPNSAEDRAKVRAIALQIVANIQPLQNLTVIGHISLEGDKRVEWARHWITVGFEKLEKVLAKTVGKYAYGDQVTLADICIVPQMFNARRFGVDVSKFPLLLRLEKEINAHPEFLSAHAQNQPDTPEQEKQK